MKRRPWVSVAVKTLGGLHGAPKHDLIFPKQVICAFGFCISLPTFFLGEEDVHGYHPDAEGKRHDGMTRFMTAKPLWLDHLHPLRS